MDKKRLFAISMLMLVVLSLSAFTGFSLDLSEFPSMLVDGNSLQYNTAIIVGKAAQAEDVLGAVDIAMMLQRKVSDSATDVAKLDTEVKDITAYKSIVVGGPCINSIAARLLKYPTNCMEGFQVGKAMIRLFPFDNSNFAILVAGATAQDTKRATYALSHYQEFNLQGTEREVSGISLSEVSITKK